MWKLIPNNNVLFISFEQKYDYEIFVTDYLTLWFVRLTEIDFVNCLKESNTTIEIDDDALKNKGIQMLLNPDKLRDAELKINGQTMHISMSMSFGYSLKLNLSLRAGSKEMFFQKITQPLLRLAQDLKSSDKELRHLLNKKDLEIEEYKSEGAQVVRHFKTPKFDEENHMNQFKSYTECFGSSEIPKSILERYVDFPENIIVKQEPTSVKVEPTVTTTLKSESITSVVENHTIQATVSVKREHVKTEPKPISNDPRKRMRARLNL